MRHPSSSFGERVREARKARKLSQQALAELVGVSSQSISYWESDRNKPEADTLSVLAEMLGVSATYLLTGESSSSSAVGQFMVVRGQGRIVPVFSAHDVVKNRQKAEESIQTHWMCGPRSYVVPLWDEANTPIYLVGDHVVFDPDEQPVPGDMVLVATAGGFPIFGRLTRTLVNGSVVETVEFLNAVWGAHVVDRNAGDQIVAVMVEHARRRGTKTTP